MSTVKSIRAYRSAIMATASLAAVFAASGAAAQSAQQAQGAAVAEEIVVTGTRVIRDGYEAPTPVSVLGTEELNAMAVTNIADAVNRLPSFGAGLTSRNTSGSVSGGIGGLNLLNLRSLGATRTLVLLDGRRVVGANVGGNSGSAVDINGFPNGLISRIDVVTGGASAAYGSDAVAGVVNFVVDKEFTGIKGVVDTGITTYGDDAQYRVSLSAGSAFAGGRGHVLFSGEVSKNVGMCSSAANMRLKMGSRVNRVSGATAPSWRSTIRAIRRPTVNRSSSRWRISVSAPPRGVV